MPKTADMEHARIDQMAVTAPAPGPANDNAQDYNHIRNIISYLSENWREQPSLEELANLAQLSPAHLQKIFTRWAGVSPKGFLQALTLDHARDQGEGIWQSTARDALASG